MKAMETLQDLIEEAKLRTVWWALCIFAISYFLSHTSKSMWMNIPISILLVSALRILSNEVEFRWRVRSVPRLTFLSHLEKKQLSVNDSRLATSPPPPKWKRKIDSPIVEAAMSGFIDKILKDFVVDLWYSDITPDREAPELIRAVIMDVLGEISGRVKEINLVDLLTRDIVDLIGNHLDLFRRNQAAIGVDVMGTLSSEERDERLKHHLMASKELHPALISSECEYKVLQRLIGGLLAVVLRPREAQCPLVRCIAREIVTCLVMQPVMNLASPIYINELIECLFLAIKDGSSKDLADNQLFSTVGLDHNNSVAAGSSQNGESTSRKYAASYNGGTELDDSGDHEDTMLPRPADWARLLEAATQRRTEVLTPENLENMWTKGRNYKAKVRKDVKAESQAPVVKGSGISSSVSTRNLEKEILTIRPRHSTARPEDRAMVPRTAGLSVDAQLSDGHNDMTQLSQDLNKGSSLDGGYFVDGLKDNTIVTADGNKSRLKRSNSTSALKAEPDNKKAFTGEGGGPIISEFYSPNFDRDNEVYRVNNPSDMMIRGGGPHDPKLKCRVIGAYFEKLGSKSFAVYSIAVTDAESKTWFVKRRYRNFERLHRHLKDIPNYTLHLPPKRIFSSSTEDSFVHQRCIQLDKYLQDLLSIANVAEQHEVWDFLNLSSKNYSFGKSSSVMRTLAVNVDDAVDDIVRQVKGVSDGLMRKVVGSSSSPNDASPISGTNLSWHADEALRHDMMKTESSFSEYEEGDKDGTHGHEEVESSAQALGWHSDNELNSKGFPPRVIKRGNEPKSLDSGEKHGSEMKSEWIDQAANFLLTSDPLVDLVGMPPEWAPPNVSVPLLNLVDKVFQLKRRGWLRRQVFWISKQILQLIMEDAIDDWLLRQIQLLRKEEVIAQGIRWVQDVLWPDGTFFIKLGTTGSSTDDSQSIETASHVAGSKAFKPGSFELQFEASRRASDVKKIIFNGAPTALVSLIGHKQYKKCAKDIYYFLQSTVCVKQLAYGILELLVISVFPELRELVLDIHAKK